MNLKKVGIVRPVDDVGRYDFPQELLDTLHFKEGDPFYVTATPDDELVFKKIPIGCAMCGSATALTPFKEKQICSECIQKITEA